MRLISLTSLSKFADSYAVSAFVYVLVAGACACIASRDCRSHKGGSQSAYPWAARTSRVGPIVRQVRGAGRRRDHQPARLLPRRRPLGQPLLLRHCRILRPRCRSLSAGIRCSFAGLVAHSCSSPVKAEIIPAPPRLHVIDLRMTTPSWLCARRLLP
jgi:hypothetical protein